MDENRFVREIKLMPDWVVLIASSVVRNEIEVGKNFSGPVDGLNSVAFNLRQT